MNKTLLSKIDVCFQHATWTLSCNKVNTHGPVDRAVTIEFARNEVGSLRLKHNGERETFTRSGYIIPSEVWAGAEKLIAAK